MLNSFRELKSFQLAEYILLLSFAFVIPFSWTIATYVMIALFFTSILRGFFENGYSINKSQYKNKFAYFIFIAFWFIYAISFLYSDDSAEARIQIGKKLSFLLFPIFFLCSNLSYLTKDRIRTIMYFFVFGTLALFIVNFIWATYDVLFENAKNERFYDPIFLLKGTGYIHHAYISIYTCLGITFCFTELFNKNLLKSNILNIIFIIFLLTFTIISRSRAGLLCIVLIFAILLIWLIFYRKKYKTGIYVGLIMACVTTTSILFFKDSVKRVTDTVNNLQNIEKEDRRISIYKGCKELIFDNFVFGVGAGDRPNETLNSYQKKKEEIIAKIKPSNNINDNDFDKKRRECLDAIWKKHKGTLDNNTFKYAEKMADEYGCDYVSVRENLATYLNINVLIESDCNAHNQFADTIIAIGIFGLLLYLSMFIMPIYLWIKNKQFDIVFFTLLFIIAFNSLFESIMERQMGIMFFVFFYFLLFHNNFCQQTTDFENLNNN